MSPYEKLRLRNTEETGRRRRSKAWKDKEVVRDGGEDWYSLRRACRYLSVSTTTLYLWAGLNRLGPRRGCHWLDGAMIETRELEAAFGRMATYFRKQDLDRVRQARAARKPAPEHPGLVHIGALAKETG